MRIPGAASQSSKARDAYAAVKALAERYPTEQALLAAGFRPRKAGGSHYVMAGPGNWTDGQTTLSHLVVKNGRVVQAQFDSKVRSAGDQPPSWAGVQWHHHDHGRSSWMFHVSVDEPIDRAFVEHGA